MNPHSTSDDRSRSATAALLLICMGQFMPIADLTINPKTLTLLHIGATSVAGNRSGLQQSPFSYLDAL